MAPSCLNDTDLSEKFGEKSQQTNFLEFNRSFQLVPAISRLAPLLIQEVIRYDANSSHLALDRYVQTMTIGAKSLKFGEQFRDPNFLGDKRSFQPIFRIPRYRVC